MSQANAGKTYYANKDESGLALTTNPNYTLATANVPDADAPLDCTYNYKVTATVTKAITDGSDSNVIVTVGNKTMTLKELTTAGTNGIIVSGEFKNLVSGTSQTISLSSSVENTASTQDSLVGNSYTINITPYNNGDTKAFSCKLHEEDSTLATYLINNANLWQSGLEGDGYRYVGTGATCSYDNGNYTMISSPSCLSLYNYTRTRISDGSTTSYTYQTDCPYNTSTYNYSCTELKGTASNSSNVPNNFICFGTTDKTECSSNQDKYMYRILGVFPDASGNQHVKLIKYKQLGYYAWHSDKTADTSWENSDMYKGLNGSYFLTNTTYDYLQNNTWLNKILNWTWSAVNTLSYSNSGPNYLNISPKEMYLHEMNRSTKANTIGNWTTPSAKIGLIYVSDYTLSLGSSALTLTTGTYTDKTLLKTGWMHQSNNDTAKSQSEWTLSRNGDLGGSFDAWYVKSDGDVRIDLVTNGGGFRPVFYLESNVKLNETTGDGSLSNPYIIEQ